MNNGGRKETLFTNFTSKSTSFEYLRMSVSFLPPLFTYFTSFPEWLRSKVSEQRRKEGNTHCPHRPSPPPLSHPAVPLRLRLTSSDPKKVPRSHHAFGLREKFPVHITSSAVEGSTTITLFGLRRRNMSASNSTDVTNPA